MEFILLAIFSVLLNMWRGIEPSTPQNIALIFVAVVGALIAVGRSGRRRE